MKKFLIKESQLKQLVQRKSDKKIFEEIKNKINNAEKKLNENVLLNESINNIIYSYKSKGLINENIINMLNDKKIITNTYFK